MAFGDSGKHKKTFFEKLTMFVVLNMLFVTLAIILRLQLVYSADFKYLL